MTPKEILKEVLVASLFFAIATPIAISYYQSQQAEKERVKEASRHAASAIASSGPDPLQSSSTLVVETSEGLWSGKVSFDPSDSDTLYCRALTVSLAKEGKLSTIHLDPACMKWIPSPAYFEQNSAVVQSKISQPR